VAWKESYRTASGNRKYRVVWCLDPSRPQKKKSNSFDRSKDADVFLVETKRRAQLGALYQEAPETFGDFAGLALNGKRVKVTGDGWFGRYRQTVRASTYDRRCDLRKHLADLIPVRIDRIGAQLVEDIVLSVYGVSPRTGKAVHETIQMILKAAKVRAERVQPDVLELLPPHYEPRSRSVR
jgi:hypothetical protein